MLGRHGQTFTAIPI
jgi:hypothetical protein